ncbi:MAG TPA: 16S rRNA (guanine(966)-N(2))-methyltransferase RsmD [Gammaproteobacteria bacterium]|nr:16S rRNA (guanine(966)-N(2))-methyltransferase RsmD [Gammaproteobacteria bacterium]
MAHRHNPGRGYREEFRIIGGQWRRRRLHFPPLSGIRPSPDRVRETLFNWLRDRIEGAACLDLFAGSGALGLEALSRGAASVTFIDKERQVIEAIRGHLELLKAEGATLVQADALAWLAGAPKPMDLVFLDPPFDADLVPEVCIRLAQGWLKRGAWVYVEHAAERVPQLPSGWEVLKESRAGRVGFRLVAGPV